MGKETKPRVNLFEKFKQSGWTAFDTYTVSIVCKDLVGGLPANKKMIEAWVNATNKTKSDEERRKIIDSHIDKLEKVEEEVAEKHGIMFARLKNGELAIEGRQIKAMFKEAGNIIAPIAPGGTARKSGEHKGKIQGVQALRSKIADRVFVVEDYIGLGRFEPDEVLERPIHVVTPQGPRTSIKRCEILKDVEITFTVKRCRGPKGSGVPMDALMAALDYAQTVGLGSDRSQGRGQFEAQTVEQLTAGGAGSFAVTVAEQIEEGAAG